MIVANAFTFAYPVFSHSGQVVALRGAGAVDRLVQITIALFVEGKFYTLLGLLFGAGLLLQRRRAQQRGTPLTLFYLRRLLALLVLGVAHGVLLYAGDILAFYALIALAALPFLALRGRKLLVVAITIFVAGLLLTGTVTDTTGRPDWQRLEQDERLVPEPAASALPLLGINRARFIRFMGSEQNIYQRGRWIEITTHRAWSSLLLALPAKLVYLGLYVLGLFLLGMALVDADVLKRLDALQRIIWPPASACSWR